jgi:hypothetical protein
MTLPRLPDGSGQPAVTPGPDSPIVNPVRGRDALRESERQDLEQRLRSARSSARRHGLWAVLGFSPGALIPMLGVLHEYGAAAVVAISVFVVGMEAWRAVQAHMDAAELAAKLDACGEPGSRRRNSYQAPPSQERGVPPGRAAEQRGKRERMGPRSSAFISDCGCGAGRALHQTPIEGRPA